MRRRTGEGVNDMRIFENRVLLTRDEVGQSSEPSNRAWARSMIRLYGLGHDFKGRLAQMIRSPELLREAGYEPIVVNSEKEAEELLQKWNSEKVAERNYCEV